MRDEMAGYATSLWTWMAIAFLSIAFLGAAGAHVVRYFTPGETIEFVDDEVTEMMVCSMKKDRLGNVHATCADLEKVANAVRKGENTSDDDRL